MTAYERISQLKKKREEYVKVSKDNNMYEGTKKILTDMYPDTAHFIYELLQNAEDMHATEVAFRLFKDKLVFEHNGTKRDFIIDDIDSITSIGNNKLKKDDKTSIGKFGVGFKAVYTYTKTPEIHSGEYDFCIQDMFVPDPDGVEKTAKKGFTQFIFPFNHDAKTPQQAVKEITEGLLELDENSVLFLRHIKQVGFMLPDKKKGGVKIDDQTEVLKRIRRVSALTGDKTDTYWSKFSKDVGIKLPDEQEEATYSVSIAYKMKKTDSSFSIDSSLNGNVCIYFPAVKEKSNLHFHINAPFASTVARDSVRNCPENLKLIAGIADLVVTSLYYFKAEHSLSMDVYEGLPNRRDFEYDQGSIYRPIYAKVIEEFKKAELIVNDRKEYCKVGAVMQTSREIVKLFSSEDILQLYEKTWVPAVGVQSRTEYFFADIGVQRFDRRSIAEMLSVKPNFYNDIFEKKNENGNVEWFKEFYALLHDVQGVKAYTEPFKRVAMIKCLDGKLHSAREHLYIKTDYEPKHIVKPIYVDLGTVANNTLNEKAKNFLDLLNVQYMSEKIDIMSNIEKEKVSIDDMLKTATEIVEAYKKNKRNIEVFKGQKIFLGQITDKPDSHFIVSASDCCFSSAVHFFYRDTTAKYILEIEQYKQLFNAEDFNIFCHVFKLLGGKTEPIIEKREITSRHPQYSQMNTARERYDTAVKEDYAFSGAERLDEIAVKGLYEESLLLWNMVVADKNVIHHLAFYAANGSQSVKEFESTAAYYLRRKAWIPNKDGEFKRPCDITKEELDDKFIYSPSAVFLDALGFGNPSKAPNDMVTLLKNHGVTLSKTDEQLLGMSEEDKQELLELLTAKKERERKTLTLEAALDAESHEQQGYEEEDDYGKDISINNPTKRQKNLEKEFEESLEGQPKKHKTWQYVAPAKCNSMEKQFVEMQYGGKCQICDKTIRKYSGKTYFEAINIINTTLLDDKYKNSFQNGWNTLCLCPNCAAEYRYCAKDLSKFEEQVNSVSADRLQRNSLIEIVISLKGKPTAIRFTPRHFISLQSAFKVFLDSE